MVLSEFVSALLLAVIQGVSEWFPVSSSGHLVLFERILGYEGGLMFDVALHFGTLMAVFVYFGRDITEILREVIRGNWKSDNGRLGLFLIVGTIPAGLIGFLFRGFFENVFSSLIVTAFGFGITGLLLWIASFDFGRSEIGFKSAFLIGLAQVLSLVPGISRSGATISSGVLLGLNEKEAMKFSFLLSIPVIFGANILTVGNRTLPPEMIWATLVSFVVGLISIHVIFRYVLTNRKNFRWFAIYCLALALGIIVWILM